MLTCERGRRMAAGMLAAALGGGLAGGLGCVPARADDGWLVSWAKPAIDPFAGDPGTGEHSIAFGDHATASGDNSIAFGDFATASGDNSTAFGYWSLASGANAIAFGAYSQATGLNAMALGISSNASGDNSTGIGSYSNAFGDNAVAVGISSSATGANTTAVGNGSTAAGDNSTALGVQSLANGDNTTAVGTHAKATGDNSTAVGVESVASGDNTTALGNHAKATGDNSTAIGILAKASGDDAIALGNQANARGIASTAIGTQALALGADSTAIGNQARALGDNSVAIGNGSIATGANTVSFGAPGEERRLTNIADGIAPSDAATVRQLNALRTFLLNRMRMMSQSFRARYAPRNLKNVVAARGGPQSGGAGPARLMRGAAVNGAAGKRLGPPVSKVAGKTIHGTGGPAAFARNSRPMTLATAAHTMRPSARDTASGLIGPPDRGHSFGGGPFGTPPYDSVSSLQLQSAMASLSSRIDDVETHANRGIAAVAALAPIMMPSQPGKTTVSLGSGYYRGEAALSVSISHRLNLTMPTTIYGSYANGGGDEHVGRAGVAMEF